ncbi:hypothetical protein PanWU01x14_310280 [Parasponia andersonii]|uniref:Transmembrane protein n=1 Tax=Parasponia andersonii TaxID=3476 RepID=A0A2P5AQE7_PARAD|nr:hypothetical protein PanWU01x14_310280 [Parasponia andersonii]
MMSEYWPAERNWLQSSSACMMGPTGYTEGDSLTRRKERIAWVSSSVKVFMISPLVFLILLAILTPTASEASLNTPLGKTLTGNGLKKLGITKSSVEEPSFWCL